MNNITAVVDTTNERFDSEDLAILSNAGQLSEAVECIAEDIGVELSSQELDIAIGSLV